MHEQREWQSSASRGPPFLDAAHPRWGGNRCSLLRDGVEAYPAMLEAIRTSRRTIHLETYMFKDDAVGRLFAGALCAAAERGVRVCVLYDWFGSWGTRRSFFRALRARGVDVRPFKPLALGRGLARLFRRDHRKLLLVDGACAFIGGLNIASHWAPEGTGDHWRDDVLRIEGPAVKALERRFWASWRMQWRERLRGHRPWQLPVPPPQGEVSLVVLSSRRAIHSAYLRALRLARRSVRIAAAYFVPDRRLLGALQDAARRGVEVSLVMAGRSDHPFMTYASRALYERLLLSGVRIFEWHQRVLHAKTAVVDGLWGTVGSFNLERTSLWLNHEVNVFFADRALARELEQSLKADTALCKEIVLSQWRARPRWQKWLERLVYLFRRTL